ncbi:hypothetical protein GGI07_000457 [Coemansia sp. Benny D115]|nr:hypothetical protein GGI07_000457 [Coemansia sp. Benny D115]
MATQTHIFNPAAAASVIPQISHGASQTELSALVGRFTLPPAQAPIAAVHQQHHQPAATAAHMLPNPTAQHSQSNLDSAAALERLLLIGNMPPHPSQAPTTSSETAVASIAPAAGFVGDATGSGSNRLLMPHQQPLNITWPQQQQHQQTPPLQQQQQRGPSLAGLLHSNSHSPQHIPTTLSSSPQLWAPAYVEQQPLNPTAPASMSRVSPNSVPLYGPGQTRSNGIFGYSQMQQPGMGYFGPVSSSYSAAIPRHNQNTSYFPAGYPHQNISVGPPPSSSFGSSVGMDAEFQGTATFDGAYSAYGSSTGVFGFYNGSSDSEGGSEGGSRSPRSSRETGSSVNWKNQPRNSISRRQKIAFYQWLLENTRFPFPSENDRMGRLAIDGISEKKFKYWFANIRCRQFTKHRDPNGEMYFEPNAKFYESCLRLKLVIPHAIPEEIRCTIKRLNKRPPT